MVAMNQSRWRASLLPAHDPSYGSGRRSTDPFAWTVGEFVGFSPYVNLD
jgi:hypothetical protein